MISSKRIKKSEIKAEILHLIQADVYGITPYQIAKQLNISRQTTNKYLRELELEKKIIKHDIGSYGVYSLKMQRDDWLFEKLYTFIISLMSYLREMNPELASSVISQLQWRSHNFLKSWNISLPVQIPDLSTKPKTYENLIALIEGVRYLILFFLPSKEGMSMDIVSVLERVKPMAVELRVKDVGYIPKNAEFHYQFIAGIIQELLSTLAKSSIYFRLEKDISLKDAYIFFELGYVDKYFQDFSLYEINIPGRTDRELLDEINRFYESFAPLDVEEYQKDGKLHYKLIFHDNRQLEQAYDLIVNLNAENIRIGKDLLEETSAMLTRKWIPYELWTAPSYAIIDLVSNFGYLIDEHVRQSIETYKFCGVCVHFERIDNGWRVHCLERIDFDFLFTPVSDMKKRRELYAKLTPDPEEFLRRRTTALEKRKRELIAAKKLIAQED